MQAIEEPVGLGDRVFHVVEVFAVVQYFAGGYVEREDESPEGRHRVVRRGLVEMGCVCVCVLRLLIEAEVGVVFPGGYFQCDLFV